MDLNAVGQGVATGVGTAIPLGVVLAAAVWLIPRAFKFGVWKETLATKKDIEALRIVPK